MAFPINIICNDYIDNIDNTQTIIDYTKPLHLSIIEMILSGAHNKAS